MNTVTEDTNTKRTDEAQTTPKEATTAPKAPANRGGRPDQRGQRGRNDRGGDRGSRRGRKPRERVRQEFDQQIISIRRVTRVMGGGRRFSFSVSMVIGNRKGKVGVGLGKGSDTALAIEKAVRDAKKHLLTVSMTDTGSIAHETRAKYAASEVILLPARGGGLRAGSSVRTVLELAGMKQVTAKILTRSKNRLNNAQATLKALAELAK